MKPGHAALCRVMAVACFCIAATAGQAVSSGLGADGRGSVPDATRCVVPAANFHGVNPWVLRAILKVESGLNPAALGRNPNGSVDVGMGQMNSIHFPRLRSFGIAPDHLLDGCIATYVAAWHLAAQVRLHGNTWFGIASYHSATPCFNARYARLLWNALVEMGALSGQRVALSSLERCGFRRSEAKRTAKSTVNQIVPISLAFDTD